MPIEDIDYLKAQSQKQSYVFLVDSKDRDRAAYPTPSKYLVRFDTPFRNVCGLEVLEATVPRTMYNVDVNNNSIRFCIFNEDFNGVKEFETREVSVGDYSLQTLVPALNLIMQMTVLGTDIVSGITVASLSSPPDVRNTLVFTCAYPFILDMQSSTIAESLGFDLFTAPSEALQPIDIRKYSVPANLPFSNPRLYASVDREWPATGPKVMVFEGPRGVLRSEPISSTSWVAQKWRAPNDGFFVGLDVAITTSTAELMDDGIIWSLHENDETNDAPGVMISNATATLAISVVDGGFSDATMPTVPIKLDGGRDYWVILRNDDARPSSVFYNDVIATETTFKRSANGASGPWTTVADTENGIFYNMGARIYIAQGYHRIEAPGIISLVGERYVTLRCPEIEDNMVRSLSYGRMGLAKMRLGVMGYSENRVDFKVTLRDFHPIGKLSRMTLRFERGDGQLYDFKGVNHTIVFALHYYEPVQKEHFSKSILNPNYDGNFHAYMYRQDEQEEDSDDQSVDYNEDYDTFNKWKAMQQRNLPEQRHMQDIEALKSLKDINMNEDDEDEDDEEDEDEEDEEDEEEEEDENEESN